MGVDAVFGPGAALDAIVVSVTEAVAAGGEQAAGELGSSGGGCL